MLERVPRIFLLVLFPFVLLLLCFFFLNEQITDSEFIISSSSSSKGVALFFVNSLVSFVWHYIGPWLIVGFSIILPVFELKLLHFGRWQLVLGPFILLLSVFFGSALLYPLYLGQALREVVFERLDPLQIGVVFSFFLIASILLLLPRSMRQFGTFLLKTQKRLYLFVSGSFADLKGWLSQVSLRSSPTLSSTQVSDSFHDVPQFDLEDAQYATTFHLDPDQLPDSSDVSGDPGDLGRISMVREGGANLQIAGEEVVLAGDPPVSETVKETPKPSPPPIPSKVKKKQAASYGRGHVQNLISAIGPKSKRSTPPPSDQYFDDIIAAIEDKLAEFNISAEIINVLKGPVVDTYELELGPGVKVSKVTSITEDLSLALYGAPIRVIYPMKGKTTVGIEVPRNPREVIYLDEVLRSQSFQRNTLRLPLAMGKDAFGRPLFLDLAGMPHMLVAGATGAGKSVYVNTILVSLLVKCSPERLRLVLIDPKQLELAHYGDLPHLLIPVVTESQTASVALLWLVEEMERRYRVLKELGVKNIEGYNQKLGAVDQDTLDKIAVNFSGTNGNYELPYIVVVIDEFADLILTKMGKDIETNICRLAAKARASGIHLIIATQRPSVDVITGLIKANFPTRVSFRVTSSTDSRTILNTQGAEKLLGMGDMLYKNGVDMMRLHSSFVSEEEVEKLVEELSGLPQDFDEEAVRFLEEGEEAQSNSGVTVSFEHDTKDSLYDQAVEVVREQGQASASMLQRRMRIGYNRAANLIEELEAAGIVGPQQGSKPREVL